MTAPGVPTGEIASRVTTRIGRREVLTKHSPAELLVLLGRAALNQGVGGRQVMIGQLEHLLEMAAHPNIELRIVPEDRGWHPGLEGSFEPIEKNGSASKDSIVFVETRRSELILHEDGDINAYRWAIDQIMKISLAPDVSLSFIADLRNRMEKRRGA
jgi:hypothetical protein